MEVIAIKNNILTINLSDTEYNILFRLGLQVLLDKWFGKKIIVLPVEKIKNKKTKSIEIGDEIGDLCVEAAVNQILKDKIAISDKKVKKVKKNKFNDAADFA